MKSLLLLRFFLIVCHVIVQSLLLNSVSKDMAGYIDIFLISIKKNHKIKTNSEVILQVC